MKQHVASFANFVCRFGKEKVLLDYLEDIVLPAFLDGELERQFGDTSYLLDGVKVENVDGVYVISGSFIKNTKLHREQIYRKGIGISPNKAAIESAPSAFFVLILNNHRMVYFPETSYAPSLDAFKATMQGFLRQKHKRYVEDLSKEAKKAGAVKTKKSLYQEHPEPKLEKIPITGEEEIETFISRYSVLKRIKFRFVRPNDETDAGEIFAEMNEQLFDMGGNENVFESKSRKGLDGDKAVTNVRAATSTGNGEVTLSGKDHDGDTLSGDNNEFKIMSPIEDIPASREGMVRTLLGKFYEHVEKGLIKIGRMEDRSQNIRQILNRIQK